MANLGTLQEFTESGTEDFFLARQGTKDVKMSRSVLFDIAYPVGSLYLTKFNVNPSSYGYPGGWERVDVSRGSLATANVAGINIGTFAGAPTQPVELPTHTHTTSVNLDGEHQHTTLNSSGSVVKGLINPAADTTWPYAVASVIGATSDTEPSHTHNASVGASGTPSPIVNTSQKAERIYYWVRIHV